MDVTSQLLGELENAGYRAGHSPGTRRAMKATPAKTLTPALRAELDRLCVEVDLTMGYISNVLIYSSMFRNPKRHSAILRLIKGGFVSVLLVDGQPPEGTHARRESPYGQRYYVLEPNCEQS